MVLSGGRWRTTLSAFALLVALAGCAQSPARTHAASTHPLPAGHNWLRVESVGVEFAVPQAWTVVTKQQVHGLGADSPQLKALADSVNSTPSELSDAMSAFDAELVTPRGGGDGTNWVLMNSAPGTPLDIEHFENIAAGQDPSPTTTRLRTPVGQALQMSSTDTGRAGVVLHHWNLDLDTPKGMMGLSIMTRDEAVGRAFINALVTTIHTT